MKASLARKIAGLGIAFLAIVFVIFSIYLIKAVDADRVELAINGRLITLLGRLELSVRTLEEMIVRSEDAEAGPDLAEAWGESIGTTASLLGELDWTNERLGSLRPVGGRLRGFTERFSSIDRVAEARAEAESHRRFLRASADAMDITADAIRDRQGALSLALSVRWDQLTWLVAVSCLLAVLAGVLVQLYHHGLVRRRRGEEALRFLASVVESSDDAIIGKTVDGVIRSWNAGAERMFGWTGPEVVGREMSVLAQPDRRADLENLVARARRGECVTRFETQGARRDGSTFDLSLTVSPIRDERNVVVGVSTVARDITESKATQSALVRERELLVQYTQRQTALAEIELAINEPHELQAVLDRIVRVVTDLLPAPGGASVVLWDPRAEAFVISSATVPGQCEQETARRVRRKGGATRWIVDHRKPFVVEDTRDDPFGANAMLDEVGNRSYAGVPLMMDETAIGVLYAMDTRPRSWPTVDVEFLSALGNRAAVAVARVRLYERLRAVNALLRASRGELRAKNRELEEFASIASHDLREPLRSVQMFSERLREKHGDALPEGGRDYLDRIVAAAVRMRRLIDDLLSLARVTTKGQPFVQVDLGAVAREVVTNLEGRIAECGAEVLVEALPEIEADPVQMQQLLQNLVGNALKFHAPNAVPKVRIHSAETGETADAAASCEIRVEDNGIGIDESDAHRIFNAFERLHGRSAYEGAGMGLAICRKIAERHGGEIGVSSRPGAGSVFVVKLPKVQGQPDADGQLDESTAAAGETG